MFILRLLMITLTLLLTGCSTPFDYAEDVDFSRLTTVALAPDNDVTSLDGARLATAATGLLPTRGLVVTSPEQAAVWLHYRLQAETKLLTTMPTMLRPHSYGWPGYGWDDDERVYAAVPQQRLVLWLTPAASPRVIWRSVQTSAFPGDDINGSKRRLRIEQQVGELLNNYPPPRSR